MKSRYRKVVTFPLRHRLLTNNEFNLNAQWESVLTGPAEVAAAAGLATGSAATAGSAAGSAATGSAAAGSAAAGPAVATPGLPKKRQKIGVLATTMHMAKGSATPTDSAAATATKALEDEVDKYAKIASTVDSSKYLNAETSRFDLNTFWADHKKVLPIHYNTYLGDCGSKRPASASVETVYSGATKLSDGSEKLGDDVLAAYLFLHTNFKFPFLAPSLEEITEMYLRVHGPAPPPEELSDDDSADDEEEEAGGAPGGSGASRRRARSSAGAGSSTAEAVSPRNVRAEARAAAAAAFAAGADPATAAAVAAAAVGQE